MNIVFKRAEIDIILEWIESSVQHSTRFGGSDILFPTDVILVNKLKKNDGACDLSVDEIASIAEAMETSVCKRYGTNKYLFGLEKAVYDKIIFLHTCVEE